MLVTDVEPLGNERVDAPDMLLERREARVVPVHEVGEERGGLAGCAGARRGLDGRGSAR